MKNKSAKKVVVHDHDSKETGESSGYTRPFVVMIPDDVQCTDCGCDLPATDDSVTRCDTCRDHHNRDCGRDCPFVCDLCGKHHFGICTFRRRE